MNYVEIALLGLIVVCGIATCLSKNMMVSLIIFMAYSVLLSVVWGLLKAPDLAVTEASVGTGISSMLLFISLKKLHDMKNRSQERKEEDGQKNG